MGITLTSLLLLSLPAHSVIYSWKDENGKTHFGDRVIEGVDQKKVELKVQESTWKKFDININDVDNVLTNMEKMRINRDVNTVYQFFDKILYFDIYKTVPVKIRIYKSRKDYQRYITKDGNVRNTNSRGIYFPVTNEIVVYINPKQRWRTFWTIKHETSHAIVDTVTPFVPAWLNEGLAENMEAIGVKEKTYILYPHHENYNTISQALTNGRKLNVKQLLSLSSTDFYKRHEHRDSPHQAFSGELIRMFLSSKQGKSFITRMMHIYERGSRSYSSNLVDKHYIGGLTILQFNWNDWISRKSSIQVNL
ncbi:MAG: DUF4124 domain-containing protein [Candidatus Thiodiazotropha sp. L084R]